MLHVEAERHVVLAANRDAELHQQEKPGKPVDDLWAATRWELSAREPELAAAAGVLRDFTWELYRESLRNAVRVLSAVVKLRIEHWLDAAVEPDFHGTLTAAQVEALNLKLSKRDQALLIRAGGAAIVARYTELRLR